MGDQPTLLSNGRTEWSTMCKIYTARGEEVCRTWQMNRTHTANACEPWDTLTSTEFLPDITLGGEPIILSRKEGQWMRNLSLFTESIWFSETQQKRSYFSRKVLLLVILFSLILIWVSMTTIAKFSTPISTGCWSLSSHIYFGEIQVRLHYLWASITNFFKPSRL